MLGAPNGLCFVDYNDHIKHDHARNVAPQAKLLCKEVQPVLRQKGCPDQNTNVVSGANESTVANGVQCCSFSGDTCSRDAAWENKNYTESVRICSDEGKRLCAFAEMESCCNQGHNFSSSSVWAFPDLHSALSPLHLTCSSQTCEDKGWTDALPSLAGGGVGVERCADKKIQIVKDKKIMSKRRIIVQRSMHDSAPKGSFWPMRLHMVDVSTIQNTYGRRRRAVLATKLSMSKMMTLYAMQLGAIVYILEGVVRTLRDPLRARGRRRTTLSGCTPSGRCASMPGQPT